jgi:hypothetical protein
MLVEWDVVGPDALGGGVVGGTKAGEGAEVVGEVGLVVVAAGKGELGPGNLGTAVHLLDGLLEALDAAVELGGDADLLVETLREAAGAEAGGAGELGDGGGAGGGVEMGEGVVEDGVAVLVPAEGEASEEREFEEGEFLFGGGGFAEVVAEVEGGAAPEIVEGGFAVGEDAGVVGEEGQRAAGMEDKADELGEVDGVDLLVAGVDAEEDGCGCVGERIDGIVGVGEVVPGQGDDDLGAAGGKNSLVTVDGVRVAGVPEGFDEGAEGGMGEVLEIEHASASGWVTLKEMRFCRSRDALQDGKYATS